MNLEEGGRDETSDGDERSGDAKVGDGAVALADGVIDRCTIAVLGAGRLGLPRCRIAMKENGQFSYESVEDSP